MEVGVVQTTGLGGGVALEGADGDGTNEVNFYSDVLQGNGVEGGNGGFGGVAFVDQGGNGGAGGTAYGGGLTSE